MRRCPHCGRYPDESITVKISAALDSLELSMGVAVRKLQRRHDRHNVKIRHLVMLVLRLLGYSYPTIGKALGRDHTSVMYGVRRAKQDPSIREEATLLAMPFKSEGNKQR